MSFTVYDIYPDLNNPQAWMRYEHEIRPNQKVLRHVNIHSGEIVDTYNVSGSVFSVIPAVLTNLARKEMAK